MANEFVHTMADARIDAKSLSEFVFKPAGFKVARRLAPPVDTLQFYIDRFNSLNGDFSSSVSVALSSLNSSVAEADGKVAYIETTVQDAINNTAVEGGVLADTFVTATKNGKGMVARTLRDKNSDTVSVKDFGAIGNNTSLPVSDWYTIGSSNYRGYANLAALQSEYPFVVTGNETIDWVAAKAGVEYLKAKGGGTLEYPIGTYRHSNEVLVPSNVRIVGSGRGNTIIIGLDKSHVGFKFSGNNSSIESLYIRDMSEGVSSDAGRFCKLINCKLSYNNIGLRWYEGYINTVAGNEITFNLCGGVLKGQSYQFNFYDNVVDNNLGGLGLLVLGSAGAIIQNNTIEGNRIVANGYGVGLAVFGFTQRLLVDGNWFETNGLANVPSTTTPNIYSCDILLNDGVSEDAVALINQVVPEKYRAECLGKVTNLGLMTITNNFHFQSTKALITRFQSGIFNLEYSNNMVNSTPNDYKKVIDVRFVSGVSATSKFSLNNNLMTVPLSGSNTGLLNGINGTYVHCDKPAADGLIKVDGVDLFTKILTSEAFSLLNGATWDINVAQNLTGTATLKNLRKGLLGGKGVTTRNVTGAGKVSLTTNPFTPGDSYSVVFIAKPSSKILVTATSAQILSTNTGSKYNIYHLTPTLAQLYLTEGEFYGYCIMPKAESDIVFQGATRLQITDMVIVSDRQYATEIPTSSKVHYEVGDIIYNSVPIAGGDIGWVCVTGGAPAVWKSLGKIEA